MREDEEDGEEREREGDAHPPQEEQEVQPHEHRAALGCEQHRGTGGEAREAFDAPREQRVRGEERNVRPVDELLPRYTCLLPPRRDAAAVAMIGDVRVPYGVPLEEVVVRSGVRAMPRLTRVEVTDAELDAIAGFLGKAGP